MATPDLQRISSDSWALARAQHGVVADRQLRALGLTESAIRHRLRKGRLFVLWPGVYAVGRPEVTHLGRWKAATLACGDGCALRGQSGAALWGVRSHEGSSVEVALPEHVRRICRGITARRVRALGEHLTEVQGIPVVSLPFVLVDLAPRIGRDSLEAAVNQADRLDLLHPDEIRRGLEALRGRPGVAVLRTVLDRATFRLSDSALERKFRPIAERAGLPQPLMGVWVNGFKVDFFWPALDLVVETDGGRFHRTPFQQTRDRLRDQAHTLADTTHLRFTHAQIAYRAAYVERSLAKVGRRLAATA